MEKSILTVVLPSLLADAQHEIETFVSAWPQQTHVDDATQATYILELVRIIIKTYKVNAAAEDVARILAAAAYEICKRHASVITSHVEEEHIVPSLDLDVDQVRMWRRTMGSARAIQELAFKHSLQPEVIKQLTFQGFLRRVIKSKSQ